MGFLLSIPLGIYYLEVQLLDHTVILCSNFGGTLVTFKESINHRRKLFQNLSFSNPNEKFLFDLEKKGTGDSDVSSLGAGLETEARWKWTGKRMGRE